MRQIVYQPECVAWFLLSNLAQPRQWVMKPDPQCQCPFAAREASKNWNKNGIRRNGCSCFFCVSSKNSWLSPLKLTGRASAHYRLLYLFFFYSFMEQRGMAASKHWPHPLEVVLSIYFIFQ